MQQISASSLLARCTRGRCRPWRIHPGGHCKRSRCTFHYLLGPGKTGGHCKYATLVSAVDTLPQMLPCALAAGAAASFKVSLRSLYAVAVVFQFTCLFGFGFFDEGCFVCSS